MVKPIITPITINFRTTSQALTDGVAYENLGDRNSLFYGEEVTFSTEVKDVADYIEDSLVVVSGYTDTKIYFDEMLKEGTYLNDLQAYETAILDYYNTAYGTSDTSITDGILDNLSAREMEQLTTTLINAVIYPEHKDMVLSFYAEFRTDKLNHDVYNEIKGYLTPLYQGISRILANTTDEFTQSLDEKIAEATTVDSTLSSTIITATSADDSLSTKIVLAGESASALQGYINQADFDFDGGSAVAVYTNPDYNLDGGNA